VRSTSSTPSATAPIHDIRVDDDGLVVAGSPETQLTWMDAQRDGVTFTPRHGKAVEINALWHHGLLVTADAIEGTSPGGRPSCGASPSGRRGVA
jgi:hypothetical protein